MEKSCKIVYINNFIYVTSSEEIKENEWFITPNNKVEEYLPRTSYDLYGCYKILASTDTSLGLPQPSKEWIEYFISEYNRGVVINNVLVEYENSGLPKSGQGDIIGSLCNDTKIILKLNSNNTINILIEKGSTESFLDTSKSFMENVGAERMYSKDEVITKLNAILNKLLCQTRERRLLDYPTSNLIAKYVNHWIKSNLK